MRVGAPIIRPGKHDGVGIDRVERNLHVLIGRARCPHHVLGDERAVVSQCGSHVPHLARRLPAFGVRAHGGMDPSRTVGGTDDPPIMCRLLLDLHHGCGGLTGEGGAQRVDKPIADHDCLRSAEALIAIALLQQIVGTECGPKEGPDVSAEILRPAASHRAPCFYRWPRVITGVDAEIGFEFIGPRVRLRMLREKKGYPRRRRLHVGEEVGMTGQHIHQRHEVLACVDICHQQQDGFDVLPLG